MFSFAPRQPICAHDPLPADCAHGLAASVWMVVRGAPPARRLGRREVWSSVAVILLGAACAGCEQHDHPWSGRPASTVIDESNPYLPNTAGATRSNSAKATTAGSVAPDKPSISRVGGPWVSCYGQFTPSGHPLADVTRLGLMCGPVNGMQRQGGTVQGRLGVGAGPGTADPTARHDLPVKAGWCYRLFAVATAEAEDLDLVVRSSRGSELAADGSQDLWPIVLPARPMCSYGHEVLHTEVSSTTGRGRYALQVWAMPPRR